MLLLAHGGFLVAPRPVWVVDGPYGSLLRWPLNPKP